MLSGDGPPRRATAFALSAAAVSLVLQLPLAGRGSAAAIIPQEYTQVVVGTVAQDVAVSPKGGWVYFVGSTTSPTYPVTPDAYDPTCGTDGDCNVVPGRFGPFRLADVVLTVLDAAGHIRYSTFLGGPGQDDNPKIAVAHDGTVWLAGQTTSTVFEHQLTGCPGAMWIARFDYTLQTFQMMHCLGGVVVTDLAIDRQNNLWVLGTTGALGIPTPNAFQPNLAGQLDIFIAQYVPGESRPRFASYLGGSGLDSAARLAITPSNLIAIVGATSSHNFPLVRPVKPSMTDSIVNRDAVVVLLDPSGRFLHFSTYWGGSRDEAAEGVAADQDGNVFVTGHARSPEMPVTLGAIDMQCGTDGRCNGSFDAFVAKFSATGSLLASSFYGGAALDFGRSIAVRSNGQVVVIGTTQSPDFPLVNTVPSQRWTPAINFEHTFLAVFDDRLTRITRSGYILDEQYLPNVATLSLDGGGGFAYVAGQVGGLTGTGSAGIATYIRSVRLP